ncbi:hypothetical protein CC78DRAFT_530671 [Lojkania enalia]|uniref:DUF1993 domain-containing protein n=1 Tax=Lojkania enalia TaxID=147567 RepID=A0A9P4N2R1_9PLEO|nr:hypothetical protein CC78DRAFT_530671 [Didymosphaeria enalia]
MSKIKDTKKTFEELREKIEKLIKILEDVDPKVFEGKENNPVTFRIRSGKVVISMLEQEFLWYWAHPNFWFHVTTAYDILRMKGVELGKVDYLNGARFVKLKQVEA